MTKNFTFYRLKITVYLKGESNKEFLSEIPRKVSQVKLLIKLILLNTFFFFYSKTDEEEKLKNFPIVHLKTMTLFGGIPVFEIHRKKKGTSSSTLHFKKGLYH